MKDGRFAAVFSRYQSRDWRLFSACESALEWIRSEEDEGELFALCVYDKQNHCVVWYRREYTGIDYLRQVVVDMGLHTIEKPAKYVKYSK